MLNCFYLKINDKLELTKSILLRVDPSKLTLIN